MSKDEGKKSKSAKKSDKGPRPQRMSGFDFATWRTASDDPVMRSTIIGLLVLEKSPDWDTLVSRFDRTSRLTPALREKVVDEGGLTNPRTIFDEDFDLSFHLVRFRMPEHCTWDDVLLDARRQSMTDFDRDRPLWRCTLLEGLPGGQAAIILKVNHALMDGQGLVMLGATLFDFTPEPAELGPMPDAPTGQKLSRKGFAKLAVKDNVGWAAKTTQEVIQGAAPATLAALRSPAETIAKIVNTVGSLAKFTEIPTGPLSPIMTKRGINYHFYTIELPFSEIRTAGKSASHTANDVFMAGLAEGLGLYHKKMGHPVDKLRVNMPVSLRKPGDNVGMAVTVARFELPIAIKESKSLMDQVSTIVAKIRKDPAMAFTDQLGELSRFVPSEIVVAAAQASDVTASNVPGIPVPVWIAGAKVTRMYPLVATVGAAVNITMLTYDGVATMGVSIDDAAVANRDDLMAAFRQGFSDTIGLPVPDRNPISGEIPAKKVVAKKAPAKKVVAKKAPVKKAPVKKVVAKKAPVKKVVAKKAPAKKALAKKAPVKNAPAKK